MNHIRTLSLPAIESLAKAIPFAFIVALPLIIENSAMIGKISLVFFLESSLAAIVIWGQDKIFAPMYKDNPNSLSVSLLIIFFSGLIFLIPAMLTFSILNISAFNSLLISISATAVVIANIISFANRIDNQMKQLFVSRLVFSFAKYFLGFVALLVNNSLNSYLYTISIVSLTFILYFFLKNNLSLKLTSLSKIDLISQLRSGSPLVYHAIAIAIMTNGDKYILQYYAGSESLAYYSPLYSLGASITFAYAITTAMLDGQIFRSTGDPSAQSKSIRKFSIYSNYISTLLILIMIPALPLYAEFSAIQPRYLIIFDIILASHIFNVIYFASNYYLTTQIRTKSLADTTFITAGISLASYFVLIPKFFAIGAAVATFITYFLLAAISSLATRKIKDMSKEIIYSCLLIAIYLITFKMRLDFRMIIMFLLLVAYYIYNKRNARI